MFKKAKFLAVAAIPLILCLAWFLTPMLFEKCPQENSHFPSYYTLLAIKDDGRLLQISDGTQFIIPHEKRTMVDEWHLQDPIDLLLRANGSFQIRNRAKEESVVPLSPTSLPPRGPKSHKIASISADRKEITLQDGHKFTSHWIGHEWRPGMALLIVQEADSCGELTFYTPYFQDGLKVVPLE